MAKFIFADCRHNCDGVNFEIHFDQRGEDVDVSKNSGNSPIVVVAIGLFFIIAFTACCCICIKQFYFRRRREREPSQITIHATGVFTITNNNSTPPPRYDELNFAPSTSVSFSNSQDAISTISIGGIVVDGALTSGIIPLEPPPPYDSIVFTSSDSHDSSTNSNNSGGSLSVDEGQVALPGDLDHVSSSSSSVTEPDRDVLPVQRTRSAENEQTVQSEESCTDEQNDHIQNATQSEQITPNEDMTQIEHTSHIQRISTTPYNMQVTPNENISQNCESEQSAMCPEQMTESELSNDQSDLTIQNEQVCRRTADHADEGSHNGESPSSGAVSLLSSQIGGTETDVMQEVENMDMGVCQMTSLTFDTELSSTNHANNPPDAASVIGNDNTPEGSDVNSVTYTTDISFV